jgi:hypothetical protein
MAATLRAGAFLDKGGTGKTMTSIGFLPNTITVVFRLIQ